MGRLRAYRRPAAGFTVVELMVVIAIIAIIVAFGIPSYNSVTTQNRMAGEINDLSNDVEFARSSAISSGTPVIICPSTTQTSSTPTCSGDDNWSTGWVVFTDVADNQTFGTGDAVIRIHAALSTDTLTGTSGSTVNGTYSGSVSYLEFNRMGGASNGTTTGATYSAISLHNSTNNVLWRRCLVVSGVGTTAIASDASPGTLNSETLNGSNCP
jgi:type IV fimbrial biogenesis protein FimT